ncbi:unnamed protein product [Calypogeia fissa]
MADPAGGGSTAAATSATSEAIIFNAFPDKTEKKSVKVNHGKGSEEPEGTAAPGDNREDHEAKDSTLDLERKKKDEAIQTVSLRKLFEFADGIDVLLMIVGSIGAIGAGVAQPLMTLLFGELINAFGQNYATSTHRLVHEVNKVVLDFVYLGIGCGVGAYLEVACWTIAGERQAARIRCKYLRAILRQDILFFDTDTSTGEVITRMSGDTVVIQEALGEKVGKFIMLFAAFVGGFIVAFIRSWKLTLVLMAVMPILVMSGSIMAIFISKTTTKSQSAYASAGTVVEQVIGAIRTVASYTGEKKAVLDYDKNLQQAEKAGMWEGLGGGLGFGFLVGTLFASYSLALWYGSKLVLNDGLNGGQVINVIFAVVTGAMALGQASPSVTAMAAGKGAAYKIFEVIKRVPVIDISDDSGLVPDKVKGDVELRGVDFRYPTRPEVLVFSKFSLSIPAGKTVALVGESGSGKSTVVSLIERFYDPESGSVLLDGVDIKTIQLKWLRQQIGLVSQEPVLFSTSVKENIAYGKENATMEEIENAAVLANAYKFITRIPTGFETLVGERGIQLSGGQKQRVAIARAILKNPRILLLDEATSALDAESERVVQDALERVMTDRTTVIVAHRLTTIRNADMIAVIQRGVIVETGTHDELIGKPDGAYSQLVHLQEVYGKDEPGPDAPEDPDFVPELEDAPIVKRDSGLSTRDGSSSRQFSARSSGSFRDVVNRPSLDYSKKHSFNDKKRLSQKGSEGPDKQSKLPQAQSLFAGGGGDFEKESGVGKKTGITEVSVFRLAKLNRPELPLFLVGVFAAAGNGLVFPLFGLLLSSVITAFFEPPHKLRKDVNFWSLMFLLLALFIAVATPIQAATFAVIGSKLIRRVRRMTFEKILCQEISWFDEEQNSSGAISARLSTDAATVRAIVGDALALLIQNLSNIIAGLVIAFVSSWQLAFVILAMVPLLGMQGYLQIQWMKGFSVDAKLKYEEATRIATDGVSSIRTVASFVAEERISYLYDEKCKKPVRTGIRQGLVAGISLGFSNFIMFATFALCFWVGGKFVENGTATFKEVFRVFFAITLSATGAVQTSSLFPDIGKVKISVNSIFAILDRKSKIDPSDMSGQTLPQAEGDIEFQHVSFFYPTRPDIQIFHDLSLKVQAGQTLALVGESGSGKSTVISLIERFYDPQSGLILLDGVEIQKLQLKWLRQQIGLVSQEPVLFDENVDWNIVYGQEGKITEAEIQAAAEAANAHNFISALPEGYKTRVGERGTQLSGGQKQRVAIARAILKDPKILLLDEATSALDAESEHAVQEALDRVMVHRTTVVVAHRLSTVRNADMIAVIKDGAIVEQGNHEELIVKAAGAYASLVKLHTSAS